MSTTATLTLWSVTVEEGRFDSMRTFKGLFTNERAARAFARRIERAVNQMYCDISIEEVEAYRTAGRALSDAERPFDELIGGQP